MRRRAGGQAGRQAACLPWWPRGCVSVCFQELIAVSMGPTLPGGLVVRIRRSHRRGPGSIPGQGMYFQCSLLMPHSLLFQYSIVYPYRGAGPPGGMCLLPSQRSFLLLSPPGTYAPFTFRVFN